MDRIKKIALLLVMAGVNLLFSGPLEAREEKFLITSYLPSPGGNYKELTTESNTYFAIASGNVGIGTSTPAGLLQVAASGGLLVTSDGSVGIGGAPASGKKLGVTGTVDVYGALTATSEDAPPGGGGRAGLAGYTALLKVTHGGGMLSRCSMTVSKGTIRFTNCN